MSGFRGLRTALATVVACAPLLAFTASAAAAPSFGHAIVTRSADGDPMLALDGRPFFFVGGAFFYERVPRERWREAMLRMREIGANTIDLYVPWNWHETADGAFDFDGHTSPRRDLREVLRLGAELGFFFVVRPGPVIRNEWRNGGYPAWLLERPEYGMPLHDVLEGRYPATATLQNAHSDDAAAEWMRNAAHLRYAERWLHRALEEFRPVADRVLAVQLDDDQGAYLDNDTYPAPHLHAYLQWLERQVRDVVGPATPVFINTYEMKVPSSSPVWAMGNWYQSDAFAIGEHDRAELAFATASLRTQAAVPLAYSEFQAGWLAGPEDPQPRPADPTNTSLAIGELAGWGLKGFIDFPLHDTLAPFGWEAPFSNALYAWDAAYDLELRPPAAGDPSSYASRWFTTQPMLSTLAFYGPALEEAHRVSDAAVVYDGRADAYAAAGAIKTDLAACRARGIVCDAIDPLQVDDARLRAAPVLVLHDAVRRGSAALVARARRLGVRVVGEVAAVRGAAPSDVTLLRGRHGTFAAIENWSSATRTIDPRALGPAFSGLAPFTVLPREARIVAGDVELPFVRSAFHPGDRLTTSCAVVRHGEPLPEFGVVSPAQVTAISGPVSTAAPSSLLPAFDLAGAPCRVVTTIAGRRRVREIPWTHPSSGGDGAPGSTLVHLAPNARIAFPSPASSPSAGAHVTSIDAFADGAREIVLRNASAFAVIAPDGGARLVMYGTGARNDVDATGALRDDIFPALPPSTTDRIAKYTHTYPAGMFNRPYEPCTFENARGAGAYLRYRAPDLPGAPLFERVVMLASDDPRLIVDERFTPGSGDAARALVSLSAIAGGTIVDGDPDPQRGESAFPHLVAAWTPAEIAAASWTPARSNGTLQLRFAPETGGSRWHRITLRDAGTAKDDDLKRLAEAERRWAAANPPPATDGEVAKRYTQSPQKRPSESSCGFESHLPQ